MTEFSLSNLICRRVIPGKDCNEMGQRIATNLIRVAATRVFSDPTRSFVELVVNAIDSTRKRLNIPRTIGKFGFGFISALYWIVYDSRATITIESTYLDTNGIHSYIATIRSHNKDDVYLEYTILPAQALLGATITIRSPNNDDFPDYTLSILEHALFDIRDIPIYYQRETKGRELPRTLINSNADITKLSVNVIDGTHFFQVKDQGVGISEDILFNTLFVVSVSTKGIEGQPGIYENHTRIDKDLPIESDDEGEPIMPYFFITVNDVTVLKFPEVFHRYVLSMPPNTPVPLARDDIILNTPELQTIFRNNLKLLIQQTIDTIHDLSEIWQVLGEYIAQTSSEVNKELVRSVMKETEQRTDLFFVPNEDEVYQTLGKFVGANFVVLPGANISRVEEYVLTKLAPYNTKNIYWNKNVFVIPNLGENITSGGMPTVIFVDADYTSNNPNWIVDLSMSYQGDRLYPYTAPNILSGREADLAEVYMYRALIPYYSEIASIYIAMLGSLPNFDDVDVKAVRRSIMGEIILMADEFNDKNMRTYLRSIYSVFNEAKPRSSYGNKQPFYLTYPAAISGGNYNREDPGNQNRDLDMFLWLHEICKHDRNDFADGNRLRVSSFTLGNISRVKIVDFASLNRVTIEEELTLRELGYKYPNLEFLVQTATLNYALSEIRSRFTESQLREWYRDYIFRPGDTLFNLIISPLIIAIKLYESTQTGTIYSLSPFFSYTNGYQNSFMGKQVFNMLFETSPPNLAAASKAPQETPFQIFDISVNQGTTKDYIPTVLTELVQNSIDAIRSTGGDKFISLGFDNGPVPAIYFQDYIGIDPKNLIYLLIPFLSSKKASELTTGANGVRSGDLITGEMGTGLFNIYRQPYCSQVVIQTIKYNVQTTIVATPKVVDGRVTDIQYDHYSEPSDDRPGTLIIIYLREANVDLFVDISLFANTVLRNIDFPIVFNGQRLENNNKIILNDHQMTIKYNPDIVSQIFTNGVPFNSLINYEDVSLLQSLVSVGFVFDIKKGHYQATQSRTEIVGFYYLDAYMQLAVIYLLTQHKYSRAVEDSLLPFFNSPTEYDQCKIGIFFSGLDEVLSHGIQLTPSQFNKPIKRLINEVIEKITPQPPTWDRIKDALPNNTHQIIVDGILEWFKNKKTPTQKELPGGQIVKKQGYSGYIQDFVNIYWKLGMEQEKAGKLIGTNFARNTQAPMVVVGPISGADGLYDPTTHQIWLNSDTYFNEGGFAAAIIKLVTITDLSERQVFIREDPTLFKFFAISSPLKPLLHELTHASRGNAHGETSHGDILLTINESQRKYSFDDGGAAVTSLLAEVGLYSEFVMI